VSQFPPPERRQDHNPSFRQLAETGNSGKSFLPWNLLNNIHLQILFEKFEYLPSQLYNRIGISEYP